MHTQVVTHFDKFLYQQSYHIFAYQYLEVHNTAKPAGSMLMSAAIQR